MFDELRPETRSQYGLEDSATAARLLIEAEALLIKSGKKPEQPKELIAAIDLIKKASRADPDNLTIKKTLGWLYLERMFEPKAAYFYLKKVAELDAEDLDAKKLFALACSGTGRLDKAIALYSEVIGKDQNDLWILLNLAKTLAWAKRYDAAATTYEEVLKRESDNFLARFGLTEILAWRGQRRLAIENCKNLLRQKPDEPAVHSLLGDIYRWGRDLRRAESEYEYALRIEPYYKAALDGIEEIKRIRSTQISEDYFYFKDSFSFTRSIFLSSARTSVRDNLYVTAYISDWQLVQDSFARISRRDVGIEFEYHPTPELETHARILNSTYSGKPSRQSLVLIMKWTQTSGRTFYLAYANHEPVPPESIGIALTDLSQTEYTGVFDVQVMRDLSAQGSYSFSRYSDDNRRWFGSTQVTYTLRRFPEILTRFQYDILNFEKRSPLYFSPTAFQIYRPQIELSYPLKGSFAPYAKLEAPYVSNVNRFGHGLTTGPKIRLGDRVYISGSYFNHKVPASAQWSGRGLHIQGSLRF